LAAVPHPAADLAADLAEAAFLAVVLVEDGKFINF
jgi:hypothetical protein